MKNAIVPKIETQTTHPARHFKAYMKMNEIRIAPPNAAKSASGSTISRVIESSENIMTEIPAVKENE